MKDSRQRETKKTTGEQIKDLFRLREQAVEKHDLSLFRSTHIDEYTNDVSKWLSLKSFSTQVISIYTEKESPLNAAAFVKENYVPGDETKKPYSWLVVYHFVNTTQGWKIYRLAYPY